MSNPYPMERVAQEMWDSFVAAKYTRKQTFAGISIIAVHMINHGLVRTPFAVRVASAILDAVEQAMSGKTQPVIEEKRPS